MAFQKSVSKDTILIKYEDFIYEGYGPYSVAVLIQIMTDNRNRTLPEIRSIMIKNGGHLIYFPDNKTKVIPKYFSKNFEILLNNFRQDNQGTLFHTISHNSNGISFLSKLEGNKDIQIQNIEYFKYIPLITILIDGDLATNYSITAPIIEFFGNPNSNKNSGNKYVFTICIFSNLVRK